MGTYPRRCPLTAAEIAERYQGGEGLIVLSLRCRRRVEWVKDVLVGAGVTLRTRQEASALGRSRQAADARRALGPPSRRVAKPPNPWRAHYD
jgi:hypothetical protein